jgi:16S rRNA (guanine966-N2)-methyltransferase
VRIIAGKYRGHRLTSAKGRCLRPTAGRVREAIFSILGNDLTGLWVLDLFAGAGAMGLEALSRGATFVVLVDKHPTALQLIARNVAVCGNPQNVKVLGLDLSRGNRGLQGLTRRSWRFDIVFLDPPYRNGLSDTCLTLLGGGELLNPRATVVSEHAVDENLAPVYGCLRLSKTRRYGSTAVSLFRWENE